MKTPNVLKTLNANITAESERARTREPRLRAILLAALVPLFPFTLLSCDDPFQAAAPDAPQNLAAASANETFSGDEPAWKVSLSWSGSADSWEIQCAEGDGPWRKAGTSDSERFTDRSGRPRNTRLSYRVRGIVAGSAGSYCDPVSLTTPAVGTDKYEIGPDGQIDDGVFTENALADGISQIHSIDSAGIGAVPDRDYFSLRGEEGSWYRVETSPWDGDSTDTLIEIIDQSLETVAYDDDGAVAPYSRIGWWQCPADGDYFVRISGRTAGYYRVEAETYEGPLVTAFPYDENFESGPGEPWDAWLRDAFFRSEGSASIYSPQIDDGESTAIRLLLTVPEGGLTLTWSWAVNSEAERDLFSARINGTVTAEISGSQNWATVERILAAGTHVLEWRYSKDSSGADGYDRAWLDAVSVR